MSRTTTSHVATAPTTSLLSTLSSPVSRRAALTALLLPLAACAADPEGADDPTAAEDGWSEDGGIEGGATPDALTVTDPWIKAAEEGMTSGFGLLINGTDQDLVLVGARTAASTHVELHETTGDGSGGMSMQEKEGGFPLPAGSELLLEPSGNHLMLMELTAALQPGDEVELTLEFEDGTELPFTAAVKDFAGAQEHYEPEGSSGSGASDGGGEHDAHDGAHGGDE